MIDFYRFESPDRILDFSRNDLPLISYNPDKSAYASLIDIQMERVNYIAHTGKIDRSNSYFHIIKYLDEVDKESISISHGLPILLRLTFSVQSRSSKNKPTIVEVCPNYLFPSVIIEDEDDLEGVHDESYVGFVIKDDLSSNFSENPSYGDRELYTVCNYYYVFEANSRLKEINIVLKNE